MMIDEGLPCTLRNGGISRGVLEDLRKDQFAAVQGVISDLR